MNQPSSTSTPTATPTPTPTPLILLGCGATGRCCLHALQSLTPAQPPVAFADNDSSLWMTAIDGIPVMSPAMCRAQFPDATWIAAAISRPAATELRAQISTLGVASIPLHHVLPSHHSLPGDGVMLHLLNLVAGDLPSQHQLLDQWQFRRSCDPDYDTQLDPAPISELYFPPFISHLDDEHLVDVGACGGDTISSFLSLWSRWSYITAFEPDPINFARLVAQYGNTFHIELHQAAISDHRGHASFVAAGDHSARLSNNGSEEVTCLKLDGALTTIPTYIKVDVESHELEVIWGMRHILRDHMPVLAICAYHTSEHLWQIPLLIHLLQPSYELRFERYAEGAWEIIWYAIPPDRIIK